MVKIQYLTIILNANVLKNLEKRSKQYSQLTGKFDAHSARFCASIFRVPNNFFVYLSKPPFRITGFDFLGYTPVSQ